ncbi:hypothetical protein TrCOL_g290 [Triparma columacea]|uniref:Uncharacterized protein n=1 Tax=Triparma columacea TaxID=722753 RepID=A0A9W7GLP4_9STRA|nr:hypothetical protein TrCOL_g290 [Triparma columacea]
MEGNGSVASVQSWRGSNGSSRSSSVKPLSNSQQRRCSEPGGEDQVEDKLIKKLEADIVTSRLRFKTEKEELVAQLLQLRSKYDRVLERVKSVEVSSVNEKQLEKYLRMLEERQMKADREMKKLRKGLSSASKTTSIPFTHWLRALLFVIVGVCVVFLPELPPGPLPPNFTLLITTPFDWRACLDRFGVFSMTTLLLHILLETPSAADDKRSTLHTLMTEGVLLWGLSLVVKSLIGIAESMATMVLVTVCGLLLRGDLDVARIKFPIIEDSGEEVGITSNEAASSSAIKSPTGTTPKRRKPKSSPPSNRSVSPRTAAWLSTPPRLTAYGTHVFDHRNAIMESKERLASQKRRVSTPSPMPAKQKRELEALNNIIPVTNIDTGEAVDLKFLEELTEQCNVFQFSRGHTLSESALTPNVLKFSTPPPKGSSRRNSTGMGSLEGGSAGRKPRPSLMKRLANGGTQGGSAMKAKMTQIRKAVGK